MPKKFRFTNKTKEMIQQNKVTTLKITRISKLYVRIRKKYLNFQNIKSSKEHKKMVKKQHQIQELFTKQIK